LFIYQQDLYLGFLRFFILFIKTRFNVFLFLESTFFYINAIAHWLLNTIDN